MCWAQPQFWYILVRERGDLYCWHDQLYYFLENFFSGLLLEILLLFFMFWEFPTDEKLLGGLTPAWKLVTVAISVATTERAFLVSLGESLFTLVSEVFDPVFNFHDHEPLDGITMGDNICIWSLWYDGVWRVNHIFGPWSASEGFSELDITGIFNKYVNYIPCSQSLWSSLRSSPFCHD